MLKILCAILILMVGATISADTLSDTSQTYIEDCYITEASAAYANNFGSATTLDISGGSTSQFASLLKIKNLSTLLGGAATINACSLIVYATSATTPGYMCAVRVWKTQWVEGTYNGTALTPGSEEGVTGLHWDNANSYAWTANGAQDTANGGTENTGNGTGSDIGNTATDSVNVTAVGYVAFDITDIATASGDTITVMLRNTFGTGAFFIASSENATQAYRPRFWFDYTTGEATTSKTVRSGVLRGEQW